MLNTALIGLGRIGWVYHLPEILKHREYHLCAIADVDPSRLTEADEKCDARKYTDYREMLQKERPDVVVIASPTPFHKEQAIQAMREGCSVILDKPMASDLDSAKEIAAAAAEYQQKITVYQPHRFLALATVVKRVLDTGVLGEIFQIRRCASNYVRRNDWQSLKKYGGGMLNNFGSHYIDQLLFFSGEKINKVFCQLNRIATLGDAEDVVKILLQTENGMILDIDINQAAALPPEPLLIYGKYGAAKVQTDASGNESLLVRYYDPTELPACILKDSLTGPDRRIPPETIPWKEETYPILAKDNIDYYQKCAQYFNGQAESPVPLGETLQVMELIDSCRRAAE